MRNTSKARKVRGPWGARSRAVVVAAGLMLAALPASAAVAGGHGGATLTVHRGESIQAAVNAAPPGTSPPGAEDPGLVEHIKVIGNHFADNQPVDIWLTRPIPGTLLGAPGPGINFRDNQCTTSDPAGLCG